MEPTFIILAVLAAISAGSSIMLNKKLKKALDERDRAMNLGAGMAQQISMLQVSKAMLEEVVLSDDHALTEMSRYKIEAERKEMRAANNIFNK
jgi:Na+-translocating ferredoxin:NAD+ oxidoreductase RnfG subunit